MGISCIFSPSMANIYLYVVKDLSWSRSLGLQSRHFRIQYCVEPGDRKESILGGHSNLAFQCPKLEVPESV